MNQTNILLDLISAIKKNDQKSVDAVIRDLIENAEKRKQYKLAKKLREVYSTPSKQNSPAFFHPSSSNSVSEGRRLFEIRKSAKNRIL